MRSPRAKRESKCKPTSPAASLGAIAAAAVDAAFRLKSLSTTPPTVLAERILAIESENNRLSAAIALKDVELAAQQAEIEEIKAVNTQLTHDLDDTREQIRDLQEQRSLLADLESEIDRCSAQILEKDSTIENLQKQNESQNVKIIQQDTDLDSLASEFTKVQDEFDLKMTEMKNSLIAKEAECSRLQDEVTECRGLIQEFEPLLNADQDSPALLEERNSLLLRISELESNNGHMSESKPETIVELEQEIETRDLQISKLNSQLEAKQSEFEQKMTELEEAAQKRETALQQEILSATAMLVTALNDPDGSGMDEFSLREMGVAIGLKDQQLQEARGAFRQVAGMINTIEEQMREMAEQYDELKEENDVLKHQIAEAQGNNA
jgi:chromosome segregation ATPase